MKYKMFVRIKDLKVFINYNPEGFTVKENVDVVIGSNKIVCIGDCKDYDGEIIDGRDFIGLPAFSDPYIVLEDFLECHGISSDTLSRKDLEKVVKVIAYTKLIRGVVDIVIDSPFMELSKISIEKAPATITLGQRISSSLQKVYDQTPLCFVHVTEPNGLVDVLANLRNLDKRIYMPLLLKRSEPFIFKKRTGLWPIEYLYKNNLLLKNMVFVYLDWISSMDIEYLSKSGTLGVIVAPTKSLLRTEGGFTPIYEIMTRGIRVYIGTSGFSEGILNELWIAYLFYRYNYWDQRLTIKHLYGFLGNNKFLSTKRFHGIVLYNIKNNLLYTRDYTILLKKKDIEADYIIFDTGEFFNKEDIVKTKHELCDILESLIGEPKYA